MVAAKIQHTYNEDNIEILEGLEAVRKRPGMYVGSTDTRGLHHLVWEILDNAIDEAMAGFGTRIAITIHADNSITIQDEGRGVPTGMHKSGVPTPQVVYTILHAGGKFNETAYGISAGLHGVGASVVTALSEFLEVTVYRDGRQFYQVYRDGGKHIEEAQILGTTNRTGTKVHFKPDAKVFSTIEVNRSLVSERIQESAFLLKGVELVLTDERVGKTDQFVYENGLVSYVEFINEGKNPYHPVTFIYGEVNGIEVEIALQYVKDAYDETIYSYVNNIRTRDGGTHETGLRSGITRALNDYARQTELIKERDKVEGSDYREGLTAIISVKIPETLLQFEGQTKGKLGTPDAKNAVETVFYNKFSYYLIENKEISAGIIDRAINASAARDAARKARDSVRTTKKNGGEKLMAGKLTPAQSKNPDVLELFLVEGDSAGGTAKQGRDRTFQAILPLRGKVINSEKSSIDDLLHNEEINSLVYAIGAGIGKDFVADDSRYGKIVIMTDADTDGAHIQVLLLTFFYRLMRPLLEEGRIYLAMPPLYKVYKPSPKGEKFVYAWDEQELNQAKATIGNGALIQRYKGLGEMNASQLWETTMDPTTRSLIKVTIDDAIIADRRVSILMGSDSGARRHWIDENVQFTLEDHFDVKGDR